MNPKTQAAVIHILVVASTVVGVVAVLAAALPNTAVPAGWAVAIGTVCATVTAVVHGLLGYFGEGQAPTKTL